MNLDTGNPMQETFLKGREKLKAKGKPAADTRSEKLRGWSDEEDRGIVLK